MDTAAIAGLAALLWLWQFQEARIARARKRIYMWAIMALMLEEDGELEMDSAPKRRRRKDQLPYCYLNRKLPVLAVYFDETQDLLPHYRISRATLQRIMVLLREPKDHGWAVEMEILVFMYWLSSGTSYRIVAEAFGIPKSTVHRLVHRVLKRINEVAPQIIKFPMQEELTNIGNGFANMAHTGEFNVVLGSIGGCHVRIKAPPADIAQCYLNRKLYHSVQTQVICNHNGLFLDIFVGYPGSAHDSQVLRDSPVYSKAIFPPQGYFLLGDGRYPCLSQPIGILTPYVPATDPIQACYNAHHSRARSITEYALGMMKTRWPRIFTNILQVNYLSVPQVIAACAVVHNVCITEGDIIDYETEGTQDEYFPPQDLHQGEVGGQDIRSMMAARMSTQSILPSHMYEHAYV